MKEVARIFWISAATFVSSFILTVGSVYTRTLGLTLAFVFLILIITISIIFDIVGTATMSADPRVLLAMASNKVPGARGGVGLTRHSHTIASTCHDLIGDICGTVSGATGATILFYLLTQFKNVNEQIIGGILISLIATFTVGGKAIAKRFAIKQANTLICLVGRLLPASLVDRLLGKGNRRQKKQNRSASA